MPALTSTPAPEQLLLRFIFQPHSNMDLPSEEIHGYSYIREKNPTQSRLEEALAQLDGGEAAAVFSSGMAAGVAMLQTLPPGSNVIFPDDMYVTFRRLYRDRKSVV